MFRRRIPSKDFEVHWQASPYTTNNKTHKTTLLSNDTEVPQPHSRRLDSIIFDQDNSDIAYLNKFFNDIPDDDIVISRPPFCHLAEVDQDYQRSFRSSSTSLEGTFWKIVL